MVVGDGGGSDEGREGQGRAVLWQHYGSTMAGQQLMHSSTLSHRIRPSLTHNHHHVLNHTTIIIFMVIIISIILKCYRLKLQPTLYDPEAKESSSDARVSK